MTKKRTETLTLSYLFDYYLLLKKLEKGNNPKYILDYINQEKQKLNKIFNTKTDKNGSKRKN